MLGDGIVIVAAPSARIETHRREYRLTYDLMIASCLSPHSKYSSWYAPSTATEWLSARAVMSTKTTIPAIEGEGRRSPRTRAPTRLIKPEKVGDHHALYVAEVAPKERDHQGSGQREIDPRFGQRLLEVGEQDRGPEA